MNKNDIDKGFKNKDISILSKTITMLESSITSDYELASFYSNLNVENKSKIIGVSGPPGAGKSTFLNSMIKKLLESQKDYTIAILTIDPSSEITGGSILGDKTRMGEIATSNRVFIRPSSSGSFLGGTASRTFETIKICENFGFDYIFVETVGVGQSESLVGSMVDYFIMLSNPVAGDDLQGMKRGVLEHIDLLLVNKCDSGMEQKAKIAKSFYENTNGFSVLVISSLTGLGIEQSIKTIEEYFLKYDFSNRQSQIVKYKEKYFESYVSEKVSKIKKSYDLTTSSKDKDVKIFVKELWDLLIKS